MKQFGVRAKTAAAVFLAVCVFGCLSYQTVFYEPGVYEGESRGFRGMVGVKVSLSENGLENIEITENNEDNYAAAAMEELRAFALESGSVDLDAVSIDAVNIDAVSGATVSCTAFLNALENALAIARKVR